MQPCNLIFIRKNPSIVYHVEPGVLGKNHTESAYKSYEEQNPSTQTIPLIIFADDTVIDSLMKNLWNLFHLHCVFSGNM